MNTKNLDFIQGQEHGKTAFDAGKMCVPAHDPNFIATLTDRKMGSPRTTNYLDGWNRGWTLANLAAPVLQVGP